MSLLARGGDPLGSGTKAMLTHRRGPLRGPIPTLRLEASGESDRSSFQGWIDSTEGPSGPSASSHRWAPRARQPEGPGEFADRTSSAGSTDAQASGFVAFLASRKIRLGAIVILVRNSG